MTEKGKLLRDINGLRDSIRKQWIDLTTLELTREDRVAMREGMRHLQAQDHDKYCRSRSRRSNMEF
jgi:hypothetical protein